MVPDRVTYGIGWHGLDDPGFDVYESVDMELFGEPATVNVIGSSHYIETTLFDEFLSCGSYPPGESICATGMSIDGDVYDGIGSYYSRAGVSVSQVLVREPLEESTVDVGDKETDFETPGVVEHQFEPHGLTKIEIVSTGSTGGNWRTYHTYPEIDICLVTETVVNCLDPEDRGNAWNATEVE